MVASTAALTRRRRPGTPIRGQTRQPETGIQTTHTHTNYHPDMHTKHTNHCFLKKQTNKKNFVCWTLIALTFVLVTFIFLDNGDDDDDDETYSRNVKF